MPDPPGGPRHPVDEDAATLPRPTVPEDGPAPTWAATLAKTSVEDARSAVGRGPGKPPSGAGRFALGEPLGAGGMGVVLKARDLQLERDVAVKVLRAEYKDDADLRRRFVDEALILADLDHPGSVPVFEAALLDSGEPFYAMKVVRGRTLRDVLEARTADEIRSREGLAHALDVFERVCQTVAAAHERGIVHRDLKPENVMADDLGVVSVMDWGIAVRSGSGPGAGSPHRAGDVAGTPGYLAPEQLAKDPGPVGPAADVFALGVILYEILTGEAPFRASSLADTLQRTIGHEPPEAARVNPRAGRALSAICARCLAKEPARRYPTARELAAEIRRHREFRPVEAAPPTLLERVANWGRRHPALAGAAAALVLAALLGGTAVAVRRASERQLVETGLAQMDRSRSVVARIDQELARLGSDGGGKQAAVRKDLEALRRSEMDQARAFAVAVMGITIVEPEPRARAFVREGQLDAIRTALREGRALTAVALIRAALAAHGGPNAVGYTDADAAWLRARLEEAEAAARAGGLDPEVVRSR